MTFTIRPVRAPDIPAIAAIYRDAVLTGTGTYEIDPPGEGEMRSRMRALLGAGYPYLVAELAGAVQGYAHAGPFRTRPAYDWLAETSIYLAAPARGQGAGTALLGALVSACEDRGFRQMLAVIGGSDNLGSIRLHERAGFAHAGRLDATGLKFGRWIDTVLMQRSLGAGAASIPDANAPPVRR